MVKTGSIALPLSRPKDGSDMFVNYLFDTDMNKPVRLSLDLAGHIDFGESTNSTLSLAYQAAKEVKWATILTNLPQDLKNLIQAIADVFSALFDCGRKDYGTNIYKKIEHLFFDHILKFGKNFCDLGKGLKGHFTWLKPAEKGLSATGGVCGMLSSGRKGYQTAEKIVDFYSLSPEERVEESRKGLFDKGIYLFLNLLNNVIVFALGFFAVMAALAVAICPAIGISIISAVQYVLDTIKFFWDRSVEKVTLADNTVSGSVFSNPELLCKA